MAHFFDIEVRKYTLMCKIAFLIASLLIYVFYNMGGSVAILLLYTCRLPLLCNDKCNIQLVQNISNGGNSSIMYRKPIRDEIIVIALFPKYLHCFSSYFFSYVLPVASKNLLSLLRFKRFLWALVNYARENEY